MSIFFGEGKSAEEVKRASSVVDNVVNDERKIRKKIDNIKGIINSPALSEEEKVAKVKGGLEAVLKGILDTDSVRVADEIVVAGL